MKVYIGQTRSREFIQELSSYGYGECVQPYEYPPRRHPFFLDNGAYSAWRAGKGFDPDAFVAMLSRCEQDRLVPDFIVAPDIVAGGRSSLDLSLDWRWRCRRLGSVYLAVQDGMQTDVIESYLPGGFDGLFLGGTMPWKLRTARCWASVARAHGINSHMGRCGSMAAIRVAIEADIGSIDTTTPLWERANLVRFRRAVARARSQTTMLNPCAACGLEGHQEETCNRPEGVAARGRKLKIGEIKFWSAGHRGAHVAGERP